MADMGPEGIKALVDQLERLGGVLSDVDAKKMEEMRDMLTDIGIAWRGMAVEFLGGGAGDRVVAILEKWRDVIAQFNESKLKAIWQIMQNTGTPGWLSEDYKRFLAGFDPERWGHLRQGGGGGGSSGAGGDGGPPPALPAGIAGVGMPSTANYFAEMFRVQDITGLMGDYDKAMQPILADYSKLQYLVGGINKEYVQVNDMVLVSAATFEEWADQAQYATDLAMGGLEDLYSSLKRGEDFWDALGAASTRFAETVISNWLRMKFYGVALNWISGGVAGATGGSNTSGGTYNTNPSLDWNLQSTGGVTVNVTNNGMPLDVSSTSTSTGADGGQVINLVVESAIGSMYANGKLDKIFGQYGGRRQGVRR
jgi:hypothetical protein